MNQALALPISSVPIPTLGSELLLNVGLENWNTTTDAIDWTETVSGSSTVNQESGSPHGGTYCARLDIDGSNSVAGISQYPAVSAGKRYLLSFWSKSSAADKSFYCQIRASILGVYHYLYPDGIWRTTPNAAVVGGNTSWTQYFLEFCYPDDAATWPWLYFARNSATSGSIYFDDLSLKEITYVSAQPQTVAAWQPTSTTGVWNSSRQIPATSGPIAPYQQGEATVLGSELLTDGGLEIWTDPTHLTNWNEAPVSGGSVNQESVSPHGGTYCARLDTTTTGGEGIYRGAGISKSGYFRLSLWLKASAVDKTIQLVFYCLAAGTSLYLQADGSFKKPGTLGYISNVFASITPGTSWVLRTFEFSTPKDTTSTGFELYCANTSASIYVDDISVKEVISPPALKSLQTQTRASAPCAQHRIGWKFGGTDDRIFLPPKNIAFLPSFSAGCWVKYASGAAASQVISNYGGDWKGFYLTYSNNSFILFTLTPSVATSVNDGGGHSADTWYFVVATYMGTTGKIYVSGAWKATNPSMTYTKPEVYNPTVGAGNWAATDFFVGQIALPFLVGRVLSVAEILNIYNLTKGQFYPRG